MLYGSSAYASLEYGALPAQTTVTISIRPKGPASILITSPLQRAMLMTRANRSKLVTSPISASMLQSKTGRTVLTSASSITTI